MLEKIVLSIHLIVKHWNCKFHGNDDDDDDIRGESKRKVMYLSTIQCTSADKLYKEMCNSDTDFKTSSG